MNRTPTRSRPRRPAVATILVPLLATVLVACGSEADDEPAPAPSAGPSSTNAPPTDDATTGGPTGGGSTGEADLSAATEALETADTGRFRLSRDNAGETLQTKDGIYRLTDGASYSTTVVIRADQSVTTRTLGVDGVVYTQVDQPEGVAFDQCWIRYDQETLRELSPGYEGGAPPNEVTTLLGARIDGDRVTAPLDDVVGSLGTRFLQILGLGAGGSGETPIEVAIQDGVPVGWRTTLADLVASSTAAGNTPVDGVDSVGAAQLVVNLSELGSPVDLTAPPARLQVPFDRDVPTLEDAVRTCESRT
ncbi:hypothetical protein [Nocardioides dongxiaopingii]|uniref:hypothetical protein n=1 Tax=Nocardioides dongxiaopingii TaxID=2576036 RepID=UPI0010C7710C|nr:hypothetical protein [Nocardioides dongxiaopingii]